MDRTMSNGIGNGNGRGRGASSPVDCVESDVDMDSDVTVNGHESIDNDATPRPMPVDENEPVSIMPFLGRLEDTTEHYDVCVVGAGPAGLMLGLVLARLGIKPLILDERADQTPVGRADGMQPKTIETLRMLGLADELLQQGVKIYDICLWHNVPSTNPDANHPVELRRVGREIHYPAFIVDLLDPYLLVGHQGMVERSFVADLAKRGVSVRRCHRFDGLSLKNDGNMAVQTRFNVTRDLKAFDATYLVGCDGAHSRVRKMIIPESAARDDPSEMSVWGVLDGEVDTDFPDIWTKSVVFSERFGSILIIPRERDMTRLYIEMRPDADLSAAHSNPGLVQAAIMRRAAQIILPYRVRWRRVEWFGQYRVSQRVAAKFAASIPVSHPQSPISTTNVNLDHDADIDTSEPRIFIAGDAAHTHSPKAAQGMNTALHDSWNLAWKLNLALRGLARPTVLLNSYSSERQKIARDLVAFDFSHANEMSRGDPATLADNFRRNVRFISGVGVKYAFDRTLNWEPEGGLDFGSLGARPGCTLPPGKVSRYIDANPVDVQIDVPVLGQFRVYMFVPDVCETKQAGFLRALCSAVADPDSLMSRLSAAASKSYLERPRVPSPEDLFKRPERYTAVSQLFCFALITSTEKQLFELSDLPPILSRSPWTIYLDDVPDLDTRGSTCTAKYLGSSTGASPMGPMMGFPTGGGSFTQGEDVAIVNVRPDGYVGSVRKWNVSQSEEEAERMGKDAAAWLDMYFGGFLQVSG